MKVLLRSRFGKRLLGVFFLLSLPVILAGWLGIHKATGVLLEENHAVLRVASDGAEAQLRECLVSLRRMTELLARKDEIRAKLNLPDKNSADLGKLLGSVKISVPEADELFCLNDEGKVIASSSPQMRDKDLSGSAVFRRGRESFYPGDVVLDAGTGKLRWRMSAPIRDPENAQVLGVLTLGITPHVLTDLATGQRSLSQGAETQSFRIGNTGETYIVNSNGYLLTESRFASNAVLKLKVRTLPIRLAQKHREILGDYRDYRGVIVSGASSIIPDLGWVIVTEIDFRQTFAPIAKFRIALVVVSIVVVLIGVAIIRCFAHEIADLLHLTTEADKALTRGDENGAIVPEEGLPDDEIGDFVRRRNSRIKLLIARQKELVQEQERRAKAAAELEALSYSMVHDMRAPLRAIISFSDLIKQDANPLTETQKDFLARMRLASLRMDQLICDMLKYSSLLHSDVSLSAIEVPQIVRQVIGSHEALRAQSGNIRVHEPIPRVNGNAELLTECFSALLDNAMKHRRPGIAPKVGVRAEPEDSWVRILVEDNGPGIPKDFQQRLFGIFQKASTAHHGTGIGLALVRVAVERMGGRVGVISEEGKGSRFWIELKVKQ
jgi:signal transduction histidine kinase